MLIRNLVNLLPSFTAYAHCDIPCGIYDPTAAQTAAKTVARMVKGLVELPYPETTNPKDPAALDYGNKLTRMIMVKEDHARKCKEEILILWTDYFKPEHFEKFPDLTDKILSACKLCSKAKQTVDEELAEELVKAVDEIADIFQKTKAA